MIQKLYSAPCNHPCSDLIHCITVWHLCVSLVRIFCLICSYFRKLSTQRPFHCRPTSLIFFSPMMDQKINQDLALLISKNGTIYYWILNHYKAWSNQHLSHCIMSNNKHHPPTQCHKINLFSFIMAVPLLHGILIDKVFWIGDNSLGCLTRDSITILVTIYRVSQYCVTIYRVTPQYV